MEIIVIVIIVLAVGGLAFFLLKPSKKQKPKAQKQEEIINTYKKRFKTELSGIEDKEILIQKKTKLLQTFAGELNRNLFFDKDEARALIKELANS